MLRRLTKLNSTCGKIISSVSKKACTVEQQTFEGRLPVEPFARPYRLSMSRTSHRSFHQVAALQKHARSRSVSKPIEIPQQAADEVDVEEQESRILEDSGNGPPKFTLDAEKTLIRLYETYPQLSEYDHSTIIPYLELMISQSISVDHAVEMLLMYPSLMTTYAKKVPTTLSTLRGIGLNEKQRKSLLHQYPGLTDLTRRHFNKRIAFLKAWFSDSETTDVVLKSTETLTDHESILKQKLTYLIMKASHETSSIVKSKALSFPLSRIKGRHEFLIRCGLFKPIPYNKMIKVMEKMKGRKDHREKYFTPEQIVCLGDRQFLSACTNNALTHNELAAFEELYSLEIENEDSDDDSDGDGDDIYTSDEEDNEETSGAINSKGFAGRAEGDGFYF